MNQTESGDNRSTEKSSGHQWVFRVQDEDGRGPWRPGFSKHWSDEDNDLPNLQPWPIEFGANLIRDKGFDGEHFGCAVRTLAQLRRWFSPTEAIRLHGLGYAIASMHPGRVIAESENQIVIARKRPLRRGVVLLPLTSLWPQSKSNDDFSFIAESDALRMNQIESVSMKGE